MRLGHFGSWLGLAFCTAVFALAPTFAQNPDGPADPAPHELPPPWQQTDIGTPQAKGEAAFTADSLHLSALGNDIDGRADCLNFVWQPLPENARITTRIVSRSGARRGAAGLMLRTSNAPDAAFMFSGVSESMQAMSLVRDATGAETYMLDSRPAGETLWLRLERRGSHVFAFRSIDGKTWILASLRDLDFSQGCLAGVVAASGERGKPLEVNFAPPEIELLSPLETDAQSPDGTPNTTALREVSKVKGKDGTFLSGEWMFHGDAAFCNRVRGSAEYSLDFPTPAPAWVELDARLLVSEKGSHATRVKVSVDGRVLGEITLIGADDTPTSGRIGAGFQKAGVHKVRFDWENIDRSVRLQIEAVKLLAAEGDPSAPLGATNAWDRAITESDTSPACIEGKADRPELVRVASISATPALSGRWYANVPLNPTGPTNVEVQFENNLWRVNRTFRWTPTPISKDIAKTIRAGDSLLLAAAPPEGVKGPFTWTINNQTLPRKTSAGEPMPQEFPAPGLTTVRVQSAGPKPWSARLLVRTVAADLPKERAAWIEHKRLLHGVDLPPEAVLESDPELVGSSRPVGGNKSELQIVAAEPHPSCLLARLGNNGPILDRARVLGFDFVEIGTSYVKSLSDNTEIYDTHIAVRGELPEDWRVLLEVFVAGVAFENGSRTLELDRNSFDAAGLCHVRFLRSSTARTSVCHHIRLMQNGVLIGMF